MLNVVHMRQQFLFWDAVKLTSCSIETGFGEAIVYTLYLLLIYLRLSFICNAAFFKLPLLIVL